MCTGRVDLSHILRAFSKGADGVFIVGCRLNECNYITHGNFHALSLVYLCKKIMEQIGLNPERLMIEFMSGGEGILFAEVMNDFGKKVNEIGPFGNSEGIGEKEAKARLAAVTGLVPYIRLVEREKLRIPFESEEACSRFFAGEEFRRLFAELIVDKLAVSRITSLLKERALSTAEISDMLGLTPPEVSRLMNRSARQGWVRYDEGRKGFALV